MIYTTLPIGCEYPLILADPAWHFTTYSAKGRDRCPTYATMSLDRIESLPVISIAAQDAWLFLWTTGPFLPRAIPLMEAWGFHYSSIGFSWLKLRARAVLPNINTEKDIHMGTGYTTRHNVELCLIGRRGYPKRNAADVRDMIISPRREHSCKPDEQYDRIERFCDGPYLELFARSERPGWDCMGDEVGVL